MKMIWLVLFISSCVKCEIASIEVLGQKFPVRLDSNPEGYFDEDLGYSIKSRVDEIKLVHSIEDFLNLNSHEVSRYSFLLYNNNTFGRLVLTYPLPILQINDDIYSKLISLDNNTTIELFYFDSDYMLINAFSVCSYVTLSLIGVLLLYVIFCFFYYPKYSFNQLHGSYVLVIISRLFILLFLILFLMATKGKLTNQTEYVYRLTEILKFIIDLSNRIYIVLYMMYLNMIARGWQLNTNTSFLSEIWKVKTFLIGLLIFTGVDIGLNSYFYTSYIQPLKDLILFGILGVLVLNSITNTYMYLRINRIPDERLYFGYIKSFFIKKNILRYLHAFTKLYLFTQYLLVGLINYWAHLKMSMGYFAITDSIFCIVFFILLRPRNLILWESFYYRIKLTIYKFDATNEELNRAQFGEFLNEKEYSSHDSPIVIINPYTRSPFESINVGYK